MKRPGLSSWLGPPLLCTGLFMGSATGLLRIAGAEWAAAADGAFAALAGIRPQTFAFGDTGLHAGWVVALYASGLGVRIFLVAYWAAHLVRQAAERNELRKIRRALEVRMTPGAAEMPAMSRSVHWN